MSIDTWVQVKVQSVDQDPWPTCNSYPPNLWSDHIGFLLPTYIVSVDYFDVFYGMSATASCRCITQHEFLFAVRSFQPALRVAIWICNLCQGLARRLRSISLRPAVFSEHHQLELVKGFSYPWGCRPSVGPPGFCRDRRFLSLSGWSTDDKAYCKLFQSPSCLSLIGRCSGIPDALRFSMIWHSKPRWWRWLWIQIPQWLFWWRRVCSKAW